MPGLGLGLGSCLGSSGSNYSKSYLPLEFFIEDFLERYAFPIPCSVNPNALAASEKVLKITGDENLSLFSDVTLNNIFVAFLTIFIGVINLTLFRFILIYCTILKIISLL